MTLPRFVAYLVACWTTIALLAHGLVPGASLAVLAFALVSTAPLVAFLVWRGWPFYPGAAFRLLVVRPFWYTQLLLPVVSGAGLAGALVGLPFGRAQLAGRLLAAAALAVGAAVLVAGYLGSRRLVERSVEAMVPGLPPEFDGLTISQVSDLHIGPHTSRRFLRRVRETIARHAPDVVAVTGDLIDDRAEDVHAYAAALGEVRAPEGVLMIPGNHDVYAGWEAVERNLRAALEGRVLVNDVHVLRRGEATLALVGTGDPAGRGGLHGKPSRVAPDVDRALAGVPSGATVVALAHNPVLWPALAARGVALTLSGHTHWGQLALPQLGWSLAGVFLPHAMGGHQERDSLLYISPGTGYWGIPFRIGALPEVTLVTLRRADAAEVRVGEARAVSCAA